MEQGNGAVGEEGSHAAEMGTTERGTSSARAAQGGAQTQTDPWEICKLNWETVLERTEIIWMIQT